MRSSLAEWIGGDKFTEQDHAVVYSKLNLLSLIASNALFLHFWLDVRWEEIARRYGMAMPDFRQVISDAFATLREACIRDPRFSRYEPAPLIICLA